MTGPIRPSVAPTRSAFWYQRAVAMMTYSPAARAAPMDARLRSLTSSSGPSRVPSRSMARARGSTLLAERFGYAVRLEHGMEAGDVV